MRAQIVAAQPLAAGQEVHNCYGELPSHELVHKYGFALPGNPYDVVTLDKTPLLSAAEGRLPADSLQERMAFLELHR